MMDNFLEKMQTDPVVFHDIDNQKQSIPLQDNSGEHQGAFVSFGSGFSKDKISGKPRPLPKLLTPVPEFDLALLPENLRDYVRDLSERMQVSLDFVAVPLMVCLGATIGRRLGIHPKRLDNWLVVPNLWGGIVAEPAQMKTPVFNEVLDFSYRLEREARNAHAETDNFEDAQYVYEAQLAALREKLKTATKQGKETSEIQAELAALQKPELIEPARFVVNDSTVEKLGELLNKNPAGLLLYRDELAGFLTTMEKADRKGDRQFFLEAWGGTGQFNVDRIGRGSTHVDALCVSVLGGIQPGPLKPYIRQVLQNGRDADGFMPRFQMLVWPDSPTEWRNVDRLPDYQAKEIVWRLFETIGSLQVDEIVQAIRFDEAAQEVFNVWLHQLESELRSGEHPNYFISHLAKYRSLMPSLALICHCADHMDTYTLPESKVPIACAEQAAAWCDYLKAHARRIYAETVPRSDLESAHALAQKIKSGEIRNRMTLRNIERAKWSKLTTPELVRDGLSVLQEQGWVIVEKRETGGRPSEIINLHPDFHCQN